MRFTFGIIVILWSIALAHDSNSSLAGDPFLSRGKNTARVSEPEQALPEVEPPFWYPIVIWQKIINDKLTSSLSSLKEEFSISKILLVFFISLVYSMLHTGGPGHGKLILGTYFLTNHEQRRMVDTAVAGIIVSLTHIGIAFILSLIFWVFLNTLSMSSQRDMANISRRIGGVFVLATGMVIVLTSALSNRIKLFSERRFKDRMKRFSLYSIAVLSGIVPCPLAWFVLVFSISYGVYTYGIVSIVGMAIGAAITVGTTGLLVLVGRQQAMNILGLEKSKKFAFSLRCFGGVVLIFLGVIMMAAY